MHYELAMDLLFQVHFVVNEHHLRTMAELGTSHRKKKNGVFFFFFCVVVVGGLETFIKQNMY